MQHSNSTEHNRCNGLHLCLDSALLLQRASAWRREGRTITRHKDNRQVLSSLHQSQILTVSPCDLLLDSLPGHQILHQHLFHLSHIPRLSEVESCRHEQRLCYCWNIREYYSEQDSHEGEHLQVYYLLLLLRAHRIQYPVYSWGVRLKRGLLHYLFHTDHVLHEVFGAFDPHQ